MCLAVPGEVQTLEDRDGIRFGKVRFGGIVRDVCLAYQPEVQVGEFVLVHVGFAIARLDAAEAARTWALLEALGQAQELEEELGSSDSSSEEARQGPAPTKEPSR